MRWSPRASHGLRAAAVLIAVGALTACFGAPTSPSPSDSGGTSPTDPGSSDTPVAPGDVTVEDFISSASAAADGTVERGQASTGSGPDAHVNDQATVINGGSLQLNVWSDDPFATVLIAVAPISGQQAAPDYYEVPLEGAGPQATVALTMAQSLPATEFDVVATVLDESGEPGQSDAIHIMVVEVGAGEVQVSVQWSDDSDVDLYVVDPNGDTIYYGNSDSGSGGSLDLDSNQACSIDGVRNENITWPEGEAPSGTYEVRINLWDDCGIEQTSWVVTVQVMGQTRTWEGVLEAPGVGGGEEAGEVITTFEVP